MSRAFNYVVMLVVYIVSAIIHYMATELFAPGTPLWDVATDGTEVMNGPARAQFWFEILSVWVPIIAVVGITAWAAVKEYRRLSQTATVRAGAGRP